MRDIRSNWVTQIIPLHAFFFSGLLASLLLWLGFIKIFLGYQAEKLSWNTCGIGVLAHRLREWGGGGGLIIRTSSEAEFWRSELNKTCWNADEFCRRTVTKSAAELERCLLCGRTLTTSKLTYLAKLCFDEGDFVTYLRKNHFVRLAT